jgi:single-stranded-DNA-specific exonuclease
VSTPESRADDRTTVEARLPWHLRQLDEDAARRLTEALGLDPVTARVLVGRGMSTPAAAAAFLDPGLDELHSPFAFVQMEAAVDRVLGAIERSERIVIHGDYDVDGISGTVLLVTVLRHLGGDVDFILPHRVEDGYGLTSGGVEKAAELGAKVLIAVDCGITAHGPCALAVERGIDVIIVDHHLPQGDAPPACAILNPRLPESGYPEEDLAAVGLAFKLARAVLERHPGTDFSGISMLKLVALGTVADLVPLHGENRVMTFHGLASLRDVVNPGLRSLLEVSGVDPRAVTAGDVGFRIAPRINAAGRIGHPRDAAELFLTADPGRARRLAGHLQSLNSERQGLEREVFEQALETVTAEDPIVVVGGEGWHRGVIGIVASRLVERTGRPAMVCSLDASHAHGSARSVPGFDIVGVLEAVSDLLEEFGGHRQAAGFRLPADRFEEFRTAVNSAAAGHDPAHLRAVLECDAELDVHRITPGLAMELERLAPFGIGNPRPRFLLRGLRLAGPPELLKQEHLKLRLRADDGDIEALAWRRGHLASALAGVDTVSMVATLKLRRWGGRLSPQLEIEDISAP